MIVNENAYKPGIDVRFSYIRHQLGYSIYKVCKAVGCSNYQWEKIEKGKGKPSYQFVQKVCHTLHVSDDYLINGLLPAFTVEISNSSMAESPSERLKSLRGTQSQMQFACGAGITPALYRKMERGEKTVTENAANKIAKACHVGSAWILFGDENAKNHPVTDEMIAYLWKNPELREKIELSMEKDGIQKENVYEEAAAFGMHVKQWRKERHITQAEFGKMVGYNKQQITTIENGKAKATLVIKKMMQKAMDTYDREHAIKPDE